MKESFRLKKPRIFGVKGIFQPCMKDSFHENLGQKRMEGLFQGGGRIIQRWFDA
jgi:hypothetical protein